MPIRSGGRIGRKYFYRTETGEVTLSSDPNIPVGSNVYDDGVRKDQRKNRPTDDNANRIRRIMHELIGVENQIYLMIRIREALEDAKTRVPIPGKYLSLIHI